MADDMRRPELRAELIETIVSILDYVPDQRLAVLAEFIEQAVAIDDPDVLKTFVALRRDPRLDTLLLLASQLNEEDLDQLVFCTEDLVLQQQTTEQE